MYNMLAYFIFFSHKYRDADGDIAHEFYEQQRITYKTKDGRRKRSRVIMKKVPREQLTPMVCSRLYGIFSERTHDLPKQCTWNFTLIISNWNCCYDNHAFCFNSGRQRYPLMYLLVNVHWCIGKGHRHFKAILSECEMAATREALIMTMVRWNRKPLTVTEVFQG